MITIDVFLTGLLIVSTLTGLATEGVKKMLSDFKVAFPPNLLAAIVAIVLSVAVSVGYVILTGLSFTSTIIVCMIALAFVSWLCAMVGYDKVIGVFKK